VLALQRKVSLELQDEFRKIEQVKLQKHFVFFLAKIVLLGNKKVLEQKGSQLLARYGSMLMSTLLIFSFKKSRLESFIIILDQTSIPQLQQNTRGVDGDKLLSTYRRSIMFD